jgi:hypothetical protein
MPAPLPAPVPAPAANPAPAPTSIPIPSAPLPEPVNDPGTTLSGIAEEKGYSDLWAKRSEKPLQQIYGHIDRISNKEAGSLLDRYADRFGHSLDREIIVMRKAAVDEKVAEIRDAPVVELIEDEPASPADELTQVENELRELKPMYQEAKAAGDKDVLSEITPVLQALMARRKALKQGDVITQEAPATAEASDEAEDGIFATFVSIVDDLLGEHLPATIVNDFVESADFEIYRSVLESPATTDEETRSVFYAMVDDQLGNMSPESIEAFVASPDFDVYRQIGELYKEA